jgi:hypothetical protein
VDLGLSAFASYVIGTGYRLGGLADGKVELWRREIDKGRKQVLSAGLGLGLTRLQEADGDDPTDASYWQMDVVVPLRYGYQLDALELFGGPHFIERVSFDPPGLRGAADVPWLGLSAGFLTARGRFGLAVTYEARCATRRRGHRHQRRVLFDLGGPAGDRARMSALPNPAAAPAGQGLTVRLLADRPCLRRACAGTPSRCLEARFAGRRSAEPQRSRDGGRR